MKFKTLLIIGAVVSLIGLAQAQPTFSNLPPSTQAQLEAAAATNAPVAPPITGQTTITLTITTNASGGVTFTTNAVPPASAASSKLGGIINATEIIFRNLASATNWGVVPYASIGADKSNKGKVGGGILTLYNFNQFVGAGVGLDYLGQLTLVSGNVELQLPLQPFLFISTNGFFANFTMTPFVYSGIGTSISGTSGSAVSTHEGEGVNFDVLNLGSGWKIGGGVAFIERQNAGKYSGNYVNPFLAFRKGF